MKGTAKVRVQGAAEPILGRMLKERGLDAAEMIARRGRLVDAVLARNEALAVEALERLILQPIGG